jgi:hypothetical protein
MDRQRRYRTLAAGHLVFAGIVLIATPYLLGVPNAIGLALGVLSVLIGLGYGAGHLSTAARAWSAVALGASVIWAALALEGGGLGSPWWDDVIEAVVLAAIFAGTLITLLLARGATSGVAREGTS